MKQSTGLLLAALLLATSPVFSAGAAGTVGDLNERTADSSSADTPLMVIRFNQPHVNYPMPLYNTLTRALKAKPGAVFDVVSVAPRAQVSHNQSYFDRLAAHNTNKVISTMHEIGMPDARIHLTSVIDAVAASEVRIYVH